MQNPCWGGRLPRTWCAGLSPACILELGNHKPCFLSVQQCSSKGEDLFHLTRHRASWDTVSLKKKKKHQPFTLCNVFTKVLHLIGIWNSLHKHLFTTAWPDTRTWSLICNSLIHKLLQTDTSSFSSDIWPGLAQGGFNVYFPWTLTPFSTGIARGLLLGPAPDPAPRRVYISHSIHIIF